MTNVIQSQVRRATATVMFALSAVACGSAGSTDGVSEETPGFEASEVRFGTEGGGVGAVELGVGCTGTLVGRRMIVTAAHCFDDDLGMSLSGVVNTTVSYALTGTTWRCMTSSPEAANGKCEEGRDVFVRRLQVGADAKSDLAVVFTATAGGTFNNVTAGDAASGIYTGSLLDSEPYRLYGRGYYHYDGTGIGVMRFMDDSLNWLGEEHFVTDVTSIRVCRGDSGGPYFRAGGRWMMGVHSNSEKVSTSGECAEPDMKARGMRLTVTRKNQINEFRTARGIPACTQHSTDFPNHWVCL